MPSDQEGDDRNEEPSVVTLQSATAKDADTLNENPGSVDTEKPVTSLLRRSTQLRIVSLFRRSPGVVAAGSIAVLFAAAYLLAPPMGRDLAAQVAHAEFAEMRWPELLNLRCIAVSTHSATASCLLW